MRSGSLDLAHSDKLEIYNEDVFFLLVAVGCLSWYFFVQPMKSKYATTREEVFKNDKSEASKQILSWSEDSIQNLIQKIMW